MIAYLFRFLQVRPRSLGAPRLAGQVGGTSAVLAGLAAGKGTRLGNLGVVDDSVRAGAGDAGLKGVEKLAHGLRRQILVVVVVDLDYGGVDAGAQALDFEEAEETVRGGLALLDAEMLPNGLYDGVGAAASELAGCLRVDRR